MKRLMTVLAVATLVFGGFAADYFNVGADKAKYVTTAVWAPVEQTAQDPKPLESPTDDNTYWIVGGDYKAGTNTSYETAWFVNSKNQTMKGTLCIGSPENNAIFGARSGTLEKNGASGASLTATIKWFNGMIDHHNQGSDTMNADGVIYVLDGGDGATHVINNAAVTARLHSFLCPFVCDDPKIVVSIQCSKTPTLADAITHTSYVIIAGDNTNYKGAFSLTKAYFAVALGGKEPLGDPNTPNPAALTVCDRGVFGFSEECARQSANRGIRLDGDDAYLYGADEQTILYPISRKEGVAGRLIKIGSGTNTLASAWTAGDIIVSNGCVKVAATATFPVGQKFKVLDGAVLVLESPRPLEDIVLETVGTGKVIDPEGWRRVGSDWELRVTAAAQGGGNVSWTEKWLKPGTSCDLTATADAGKDFFHWAGDLVSLRDGNALKQTVTLAPVQPTVIAAVFGSLVRPDNQTTDDGTTFVFADRVLTVTVPDAVTCKYDYSPLVVSGYVTNIVKSGNGTLTLCAADGYYGDWNIVQGCCALAAIGGLGADDCGMVNVRSGASLWSTLNAKCASGKAFSFAGAGVSGSTPGAYGTDLKQSVAAISGRFVLSGATTFYTTQTLRIDGSSIDLAGYNLTLEQSGNYLKVYVTNCLITNSSDTAVMMSLSRKSGKYFLGGNDWQGGAENVVLIGNDSRVNLSGTNTGNWTMRANGMAMQLAADIASAGENHTKCSWDGIFDVNDKSIVIARQDAGEESCVTFGGPVIGSGSLTIYGICNWLSDKNTFSGSVEVTLSSEANQQPKKIRPGLWLFEGANFSCGSGNALVVTKGDVHFAESTDYGIPILTCNEDCRIFGTEETVAKIGTLNGFPAQVTGFGDLQITGGWTVPMTEVNMGKCLTMDSGSLTFANGSALTVTKAFGEKLSEGVVIASAPEGIVGLPKSRYQTELSKDGTSIALKSNGIIVIVR